VADKGQAEAEGQGPSALKSCLNPWRRLPYRPRRASWALQPLHVSTQICV